VERKVKGVQPILPRWNLARVAVVALGVLLALSAFSFTDRKASLLQMVQNEQFVRSYPVEVMTVDEFAFRLMDDTDDQIQVIDFRPREEISKGRLPKSYPFTVDNLFEQEPSRLLRVRGKINVFVANDEWTERRMAVIAQQLGFKRIRILEGGLEKFRQDILNFEPSAPPKDMYEEFTYRFRQRAKEKLLGLIREEELAPAEPEKPKRKLGGC